MKKQWENNQSKPRHAARHAHAYTCVLHTATLRGDGASVASRPLASWIFSIAVRYLLPCSTWICARVRACVRICVYVCVHIRACECGHNHHRGHPKESILGVRRHNHHTKGQEEHYESAHTSYPILAYLHTVLDDSYLKSHTRHEAMPAKSNTLLFILCPEKTTTTQ